MKVAASSVKTTIKSIPCKQADGGSDIDDLVISVLIGSLMLSVRTRSLFKLNTLCQKMKCAGRYE